MIVLALVICVPFWLVCHLLHLKNPWASRFLAIVAWICGARVDVRGVTATGKVLILANHVSWLDILVVAAATKAAFVAHDGIAKWPVIGWLCTLNNTVFVARTNRLGVAEQLQRVRAAIDGPQPLAIFPEGTTSDGNVLLPFKSPLLGALPLSPGEALVQPVALDYGDEGRALAWVGDEPALTNVRRVLSRWGTLPVRVSLLPAFDPAAAGGRKAVAIKARTEIAGALGLE